MSRPPFYRFAVTAALAELLPVPLLDTVVQNHARRAAVRGAMALEGRGVTEAELAAHCDEPMAAGTRLVLHLVLWPAKKLLRTVFAAWTVWRMWRAALSVSTSVKGFIEAGPSQEASYSSVAASRMLSIKMSGPHAPL